PLRSLRGIKTAPPPVTGSAPRLAAGAAAIGALALAAVAALDAAARRLLARDAGMAQRQADRARLGLARAQRHRQRPPRGRRGVERRRDHRHQREQRDRLHWLSSLGGAGGSSSSRIRLAAPSRSSNWPLRSAQKNAPRPISPIISASGTSRTSPVMAASPPRR